MIIPTSPEVFPQRDVIGPIHSYIIIPLFIFIDILTVVMDVLLYDPRSVGKETKGVGSLYFRERCLTMTRIAVGKTVHTSA